eukprot:Tbor_TRINITY_DN306_c0_g1::TRINITY_DN306_c0_g1_i1::g.15492::m.15492/K07152/SCO1_2; protein SCO1/2
MQSGVVWSNILLPSHGICCGATIVSRIGNQFSVSSPLNSDILKNPKIGYQHGCTTSSVSPLAVLRPCDCVYGFHDIARFPISDNMNSRQSSLFRLIEKEKQKIQVDVLHNQQYRFLSMNDKNKINREIEVLQEKRSADVAASQASETNIYTLTEFMEMEEKEYRAGKTIAESVDDTLDNPMFLLWGICIVGAAVFAVIVGIRIRREQQRFDPRLKAVKVLNNENVDIGGPFSLYDTDGNIVTNEDLKGKWMFIYFGFVNCPDICPDEMRKMAKVTRALDKRIGKDYWQPIFISIDPKRDTKEILKEYLRDFNPRILGLSAESKVVDQVARSYRVYYAVPDEEGMSDEDYLIDHSIIMYLMDPEGKFVDYTTKDFTWNEIYTKLLRRMMDYERNKARILEEEGTADRKKNDDNSPNGGFVNKVNLRVANVGSVTPFEDEDGVGNAVPPTVPLDLKRVR